MIIIIIMMMMMIIIIVVIIIILTTNSKNPDQTPQNATSVLDLHCLPMSFFYQIKC